MGLIWSSATAPSSPVMTASGVCDGAATQSATPRANERTQEDESKCLPAHQCIILRNSSVNVVVDALIAFVKGKLARHFRSMNRATRSIKNFADKEGFWSPHAGPGPRSVMSVEGYKNYICRMVAEKLEGQGAFRVGRRPPDGQALLRQTLDRQTIGLQTHKRPTLAQSTLDQRKPPARRRERPTRMQAALPQPLYRTSLEQRDCFIQEADDQKAVKQESCSQEDIRPILEY